MHLVKHPLWSRFRTIAFPFFTSPLRGKAIVGLTAIVVLLVSINGLNFGSSYVMRDFMTALEQRHPARMYVFGALLAGVFGVATVAEVFAFYAEQRLGLLWREWLTCRLIDRYLVHRAYHQLTVNQSIDNPDQRISEDTRTFTTSSLSFLVLLTNGLLTLVAFLGVLWSITPWLVLTAVLYAAAGSLGTILLGRRLVPLNNRQLQKEADFRFALVRLREGADEPQARSPSECPSRLAERLRAVVSNFREIINVTRNVGFFTREYNYLIQIIPALVVAPLYVRGQVDFGVIPQAAMAFTAVVGAFSLIVTKFQEVSTFAAVVNRLGSMWEATESAGAPHEPSAAPKEAEPSAPPLARVVESERIRYENLTLWTPGHKRLLVRELTLEVPEGKRLLVTGSSDRGKTALCLATAGQWGAGRGKVICPPQDHIRFVPQSLYTASGRLRDLLLAGLGEEEVEDDRLREVLRDVGLNYLADQLGGLDSEWDWPNDLSVGDQHALALARLLLARPRFAFLDGVPWGLPPARLERLYAALARTSITYISAGTADYLLPYHDLWLELQGEGLWRLQPEDARERAAVGEQPASAG
jgi:putative ATP-binding cassette transporter